ncbi:MAG TPA: ABC transporter ATP-binding protein [Amaricoccus sp.]|jgi:subfamily B ATP-binding cassette protein MsbA|nr:ABC transporter ATP-binding protein [Amaricoccus sp.]
MREAETARTVEPWRRLWRDWLAPHRGMLGFALLMTGIVALASAGYSKLIQLVMTAYQQGTPSVIWWGPLGVIGLSCANGIGQYYKETTTNRVTNRMETELRKTMFARLVGTDLARLQTEAPAGLAARFSADIGLIGGAVRSSLGGLSGILTIVFTFFVLLSIDWPLTLGICAVFALALVPVNRIGRRLRRLAKRTQAEVAAMTSEVAEGLAGIRMARTYRLETPLAENAEGVFERLFGLRTTQNRVQARVAPLMEVLIGLAVALLLLVVGLRIRAGTITIADFTALLTGLGVIAGPARRLGGSFATVQQGTAALDRVFLLFDVENTIRDGPERIERALGQIRFENVSFAYPDGHAALDGITLVVEPGQRVAFVGRSGAGKSTLFNLLPRLYDPTGGRILLDGRDLRALSLASLRDQIAVVGQESVLLSGTVARNIGFGRQGATRDEIEAAARAAAADGFIRALPQGYDSEVMPTAGQFSGGERQRLSIARAILRDAPILLLDEPTSALDAESEAAIRGALDRLARGRTTLVIAHRLSTVLDSDLIVVMDRGRIVERGTHAELLALGGLYADLYALQFAGAADP